MRQVFAIVPLLLACALGAADDYPLGPEQRPRDRRFQFGRHRGLYRGLGEA